MNSKFTFKSICTLFISLFFLPANALAAPGDLDTTFSQDGIVTQSIGDSNYGFGSAAALQPDGKIVVIGITDETIIQGCGIARFNTDGSLDTTFDGDGKTFVKVENKWYCRAAAVQTDGKIVVAGWFDNSSSGFAIVRLNADGTLDTTFDGDGIATTSISNLDELSGVAIQADGKIVAVGTSHIENSPGSGSFTNHFALVRFNQDGSLDTTFDGDGKVTIALSASYADAARALAIQADGKIVVAGVTIIKFAVVRFNPDGSLDTTFDGDGIVTTSISNSPANANAVIVKADGKIVAAGYGSDENSYRHFAVVQYNTDGSLDTSFDKDGKLLISDGLSEISAAAAQSDGKIVAACDNNDGNLNGNSVVRLNADGSLDRIFDPDSTPGSNQGFNLAALAIQTDAKVVAAGTGNGGNLAALRYDTDGSFDTTFDEDGKAVTGVGIPISSANATAIQPDGKIVAVGYSGFGWNFAVVRYNTDGSMDTTFEGDGKIVTGLTREDRANAAAIQTDGKIVAAGNFTVVRYNPDGSLDTSFGGDGIVQSIFGGVRTNDMAIQPDGKIVLAGYFNGCVPASECFAVMRYNPDGSLDTTFDTDGIVLNILLGTRDIANAVAVQTDGKIVVAGFGLNGSNYDFLLVRYNPDGTLDTTFDGDGKVITPISSGYDVANSMTIQKDGKIIAAGISANGYTTLVRYNADGSLDTSFDGDGIVTTFDTNISANALNIQTDGKILAAGSIYNADGSHDFGLIRYNSDGSLDDSFRNKSSEIYGIGGKVRFDILGGSDDYLIGMALDSIGRAVVVGQSNGYFTVARVLGDIQPVVNFSVGGRVVSGKNGISKVNVTLTGSNGATHTARTNSFGYYQFTDIPAGNAVIVVSSKRYTFENPSQTLNVTSNVGDLDFEAIE